LLRAPTEEQDMGLMPDGGNPFTKLDKQTVIGTLKATGRAMLIFFMRKNKNCSPRLKT
jgi:hypothetical protein